MDNSSLMDKLGQLIQNFDPADFLPRLDSLPGVVELVCRIAVLAGPLILLGLGLLYFLVPPKEANHSFGYRFYWGMGSVEAWHFTQKLAGIAWSVLGLVLTIVMALICSGYRDMAVMDMAFSTLRCILWEIGIVAASCLLINITVLICYNRKGYRRRFGK